MPMNPLVQLGQLGQSPWYDFITRDLVASGELKRLIAERGLRGMTSNPTIFEKAIAGSDLYDADIRRLSAEGRNPAEIFESLAVADVEAACDVFRPLYDATGGTDGLVSLEVSPTLATDTSGTVAEAERLWRTVARPNVMIKIPGTIAGLPAISRCITNGINVNVTLLFSVERHAEVMTAYIEGLERRITRGQAVDHVASVASFFVSRVDTRIDPMLDQMGAEAQGLRSTAAIANACAAYAAFEAVFSGVRWERLVRHGARVQRPLWASTSTKDPRLPDVYYVEALIGADTVNTLPPDTFKAYFDHGNPELRIQQGVAVASGRLAALARAGIDLGAVARDLEADGVAKFAASYESLLAGIEAKAEALAVGS
ncbi:MAG: transaldolase [Gemmatimonadota bacterium]